MLSLPSITLRIPPSGVASPSNPINMMSPSLPAFLAAMYAPSAMGSFRAMNRSISSFVCSISSATVIAFSRSQSALFSATISMFSFFAIPSRKPLSLSIPPDVPSSPLISHTFPPSGRRTSATYSPATRPISTLSAPINCVYLSPSIFLSRRITGIPAS